MQAEAGVSARALQQMQVQRREVAERMAVLYDRLPVPERIPQPNYRDASFACDHIYVGASYVRVP